MNCCTDYLHMCVSVCGLERKQYISNKVNTMLQTIQNAAEGQKACFESVTLTFNMKFFTKKVTLA